MSPLGETTARGVSGSNVNVPLISGRGEPPALPVISLEKAPATNNTTVSAITAVNVPNPTKRSAGLLRGTGKLRICRDSIPPSLSMVKSSVPESPLNPCIGV